MHGDLHDVATCWMPDTLRCLIVGQPCQEFSDHSGSDIEGSVSCRLKDTKYFASPYLSRMSRSDAARFFPGIDYSNWYGSTSTVTVTSSGNGSLSSVSRTSRLKRMMAPPRIKI